MKKILLLSILTLSSLIQSRAQNCTSFSAGIQATPTTCGLPNGSLAGSATGGVTPYTYLWSNGATAATLQNLSAGTYTLTVTASNGCTATTSTTISNSICPKVNTAATVSNITQNGATINWSAISCANKYRVVVKNVSTSVQTTTLVSAPNTSLNLTGLSPSTTYQIRIRTQCSTNGTIVSQLSPIASFTTLNSQGIQCLPPSIINPLVTTTTTATINWNASAGAVQYNIRYRTTGTTAWTTLVIAGTITGTTIQNLIPGTAYEYQIRTKCNSNPDEFSPYSAILSFNTTTTAACQTGITAHSCGATNVHNPAKTYGSMTDQQGNTYRTIVIGTQEWMAENLRTTIYRNGNAIDNVTEGIQWGGLTTGAWCYYNNDSLYECPYGKLYNWYAVADPRNVCPSGWHVPTDAEWTTLTTFLGGEAVAGGKMKSTVTQYWLNGLSAANESGFSGLPGGFNGFSGIFLDVGYFGGWWSSTEASTANAWVRNLFYNYFAAVSDSYNKQDGLSVRCLRDTLNSQDIQCLPPSIINPVGTTNTTATINWNAAAGAVQYNIRYRTTGTTAWTALVIAGTITGSTIQNLIPGTAYEYQIRTKCNSNPDEFSPYSAILSFTTTTAGQTGITAHSCGATNVHNPAKTYGTMTDQQGNTYRTFVICTQEWMAENLRTTIYRNGNAIANVTDSSQWVGLTTGAWCYYNNDSLYECPYGKLYNWYAVADPRNVCPSGWHVPTDAEWSVLINYLDPNAAGGANIPNIAGGKLKSTYWSSQNTNESGFSGLPGSHRYLDGIFYSIGEYGYWWSSTESIHARGFELSNYGSAFTFDANGKNNGFSVRCLRDLPAGGRLDEKNEIEHVIIYPNPTNTNINIVINAVGETQTTIRITDLLGRVMLTETEALIGGNNTITYNISDYAAGVYLVHVGNGNTQQVYKVVKE